MHASISARELFDQQRERLQLRWVAGQDGAARRARDPLGYWPRIVRVAMR